MGSANNQLRNGDTTAIVVLPRSAAANCNGSHDVREPESCHSHDPGWAQVQCAWGLTRTELNVLWRIWLGEKREAIGHWLGQHPADSRRSQHQGGQWGDRTTHAVDHHWREIQRKAAPHIGGGRGHVLVVRAVDAILADVRQKAAVAEAVREAVEKAVAEATEPLKATIAELRQSLADATTPSPPAALPKAVEIVAKKGRR